MFQNLLSRITEDDNPRLHRIPFMIIWIAAYGLAWGSLAFTGIVASDLIDDFYRYDETWFVGSLFGLVFGVMLAIVQGWILRRRYGFLPKFWRAATIIGAIISTIVFFTIASNYWGGWSFWIAGTAWLTILALFQSAVLFRVNRQSWLLAVAGLFAGILAIAIGAFQFATYDSEIWAMLVGAAIQAIGTGFVMLRLMANPREGIVPKRDTDEKAKARMRSGLHPFTFIAFQAAAYFMGWVMLFAVFILWMLTIGDTNIIHEINTYLGSNMEWVYGLMIGAIIGFASALAQPWLMKQHSKTEIRHWIVLTTIGTALAGIGLWHYMDGYSLNDTERFVALSAWFVIPALFQTIPMWRAMRGGWMWIATGIVTAIVAILTHIQFDWTYNETFYAVMFGGIAQAIITGAVFILLKSQQTRVEQTDRAEVISA